jgi:hypothetical protein
VTGPGETCPIFCKSSQNIIGIIKSRTLRWARHVARIGTMRNTDKILVGNSEMMTPLERLGIEG